MKTLILGLIVTLTGAGIVPAQERVLGKGSFTKQEYSIKGTWRLVQRGKKRFLVLDGNFRTRSGPDLKLFLTPTAIGKVSGGNATRGSYRLAKLRASKGRQEYEIPASVNLAKYKSLVIQCERFSKLWGGAALPAAKSGR